MARNDKEPVGKMCYTCASQHATIIHCKGPCSIPCAHTKMENHRKGVMSGVGADLIQFVEAAREGRGNQFVGACGPSS